MNPLIPPPGNSQCDAKSWPSSQCTFNSPDNGLVLGLREGFIFIGHKLYQERGFKINVPAFLVAVQAGRLKEGTAKG